MQFLIILKLSKVSKILTLYSRPPYMHICKPFQRNLEGPGEEMNAVMIYYSHDHYNKSDHLRQNGWVCHFMMENGKPS